MLEQYIFFGMPSILAMISSKRSSEEGMTPMFSFCSLITLVSINWVNLACGVVDVAGNEIESL